MIRSLIIILEIGALVMLLRSDFAQYLLADVQGSLTGWMTEMSQIAEKRELQSFRDNIAPVTDQLKEYQRDYIDEVSSTKFKLTEFNRRYCIDGDKNPFVYGANLRQICQVLGGSEVIKS